MITIVPPFEIVQKVYPPFRCKDGEIYQRSCFCLSYPCMDGTLLYHTLTGEMVLMEPDEVLEESNWQLIQHKYYVPESFDEHKLVLQIRSIACALNRKKGRSSFLIPTTTDCNARCYYCFELGYKRVAMTAETARDVATYMIRASGEEELKITWFGGEPLYNRKAIEIICSELRKAGKPFSSDMISNGYYLDPETAKKAARDWNLKLVQITLDGTKDVYQRTKAYIERDPNAFERVIDNICGASEAGIKVLVRFNMDARNVDDLFQLADELNQRLEGCRNITGRCELLYECTGKINRFPSEEAAASACTRLQKKLDAQWPRKIEGLPRSVAVNGCMADNDACETILPDGHVSKCDSVASEHYIGDIWSEKIDENEIKAWKETITFEGCSTCFLFPQCIALKRCKNLKNGCTAAGRLRKRWEIEGNMLAEYERYKNESR